MAWVVAPLHGVVHVETCAAHGACMFDVAWCADTLHLSVALFMLQVARQSSRPVV
jgi:hypothetical protein